jgi:hypothetical protein
MWVEEEEVHCQEIKTKCSFHGAEAGCETAIDVEGSGIEFSYVWVKDGEGSYFSLKRTVTFRVRIIRPRRTAVRMSRGINAYG